MKKYKSLYLVLIVIYSLLPSLLFSQWLQTTIFIPDSLTGLIEPRALAYNATNNKIYVGGSDGNCVIVIDGETNQKVARIPTGTTITAICWGSVSNKVYCSTYGSNGITTVIDGATNEVIKTINTVGSVIRFTTPPTTEFTAALIIIVDGGQLM